MQIDLAIVAAQLSQYGGAEIFLLECLKRWQSDLKITLYTPFVRKRLLAEYGIRQENLTVVRLPKIPKRKRFQLVDSLLLQTKIWEQHIRCHDLYLAFLLPMQLIDRKPLIWFAHEPLRMLYDLRYLSYGRNGLAHVYPKTQYDSVGVNDLDIILPLLEHCDSRTTFDYLLTNSRKTSSYLETVYGKKADLIVYPGVDVPESISRPSTSRKAIFVGRLWRHKRVDLLIRAMIFVPEGELLVVGDGPEKAHLEKLAGELGVASQVTFTGDVTSEQKARLYAEATCGVYTPFCEPLGMMPLEAAAAGLPLVVSIGGGYTEVLDEEGAFFVPPEPRHIAEAIAKLFADDALARRMGNAARDCAREHTWEKASQAILDFLVQSHDTKRRASASPAQPRFGAFYYPWYQDVEPSRHWNENRDFAAVEDLPIGGPYTSSDPETISRHVDMALEAGLDFLVVDWEIGFDGLHPADLEATEKLFQAVEDAAAPLSLAIMISIQTEDSTVVREHLRILNERFVPRPSYLNVKDQSPVWYFLGRACFGYFYHDFKELKSLNAGLCPLASGAVTYKASIERHLREFFRGWSLYSPLQISAPASWSEAWLTSYRNFCEASLPDGLAVFGVCPGFDDTQLSSVNREEESFRKVERDELKTYELMQGIALELEPLPDVVVLTSFNEFHENTHIEPSVAHGDRYLKSSRSFKARLLEEVEARRRVSNGASDGRRTAAGNGGR